MQLGKPTSAWWGPPKKFETQQKERRISWLELFFDLVYVIAISRITHRLAADLSPTGFLTYCCLFSLIYWGWLNGSLHHDLHGNQGLRTRLMTLWQMVIIAALAVVTDNDPGEHHAPVIIVLMAMQLFITYLWWSIGLYDKEHRKYSWPYTSLYMLSFGLLGLSLAVDASWLSVLIPLIILCNYSPPFISFFLLRQSSNDLDLSTSMFERLGLFTIIIFGELVLGVVNGISAIPNPDFHTWLNFTLAMTLVFALWWIFFTMIARREAKKNFIRASLLELLYIPTLISLGVLAAGFPSCFNGGPDTTWQDLFGYGIASFLICNSLLTGLLVYPSAFQDIKRRMQLSIFTAGLLFVVLTTLHLELSATGFLLCSLAIVCAEILFLNLSYYRRMSTLGLSPFTDQA